MIENNGCETNIVSEKIFAKKINRKNQENVLRESFYWTIYSSELKKNQENKTLRTP